MTLGHLCKRNIHWVYLYHIKFVLGNPPTGNHNNGHGLKPGMDERETGWREIVRAGRLKPVYLLSWVRETISQERTCSLRGSKLSAVRVSSCTESSRQSSKPRTDRSELEWKDIEWTDRVSPLHLFPWVWDSSLAGKNLLPRRKKLSPIRVSSSRVNSSQLISPHSRFQTIPSTSHHTK